jgi:hypothetical protein
MTNLLILPAALAALVLTPALRAEPPDDPPAAPPTLDELLGIEDETDDGEAERVAEEEAQAELQRRLDEEEIGNAFAEALRKMALAADQLDRKFDTGLGTQRVQEEVLTKLVLLMDEAKKQQCSGASTGSPSASKSSTPKPQPGRKSGQKSQGSPSDKPASDSESTEPPPARDGEMNAVFDEQRSEWGNLPQRVRDMLLQGRREKFSSLYEQLTREYYRRLAEEGSS